MQSALDLDLIGKFGLVTLPEVNGMRFLKILDLL